MELLPGDLILVKGAGIISKAIEDVEHSPYSHVAGYVKPGELIEANGWRKTGYQALDYYRGCANVFRCKLTGTERKTIMEYVAKEVGGRYDYGLLFVELLRYELHLLMPYKEPPKNKICSVLWVDAYRSAGVDLCPGVSYPSPADVANSKLLRRVGGL